ncbi:MAG: ABC transporter substrate-binding protein [Bacillota bacterium]
MKNSWKLLLVVMLVFALSAVSMASVDYDRDETLVTTGSAWGPPSSWNPFIPASEAVGTGGLAYEFLFQYDPLNNELVPWLAESGEWTSDDVYVLELRDGITFSDGEEFTAEDVAFTFELAKDNSLHYSPTWKWLSSVEVIDDTTVEFTFSEPHYAEWDNLLYNLRMVPEHIWSEISADELTTTANKNPVGTGPYLFEKAGQDRMVWVRNDNWWGNDVFGTPKPKYIVDLVNSSNNVTLGMLMKGEVDLSTNFLPGIQKVKEAFGLKTWYEDEPYMLSWNTANLYMNNTKAPMNDANFRRALAFAMNPDTIVDKVYGGLVNAANPTGLFGEGWMEYYAEDVVDEYGFNFDPEKAAEMLDAAGYVDADGDGWRDMPNGDPIELKVIVPSGWTDWMEAIKVVADNAQEVGINLVPDYPDYSIWQQEQEGATFDMIICNFQTTMTSNPFDYWNGVANDAIDGETRVSGNYGVYDNPELFEMIDEFNMIRGKTSEKMEIAAEIQKTLLVDMPTIPLWHNGLWAQQTDNVWTNWPSEDDPYGVAANWEGSWQMGMIEVLINLEPAQ